MGGGEGRDGQETPIFLPLILELRMHSDTADPQFADSRSANTTTHESHWDPTSLAGHSAGTGGLHVQSGRAAKHPTHLSG